MARFSLIALCALTFLDPTTAIWPFKPKRFQEEALINAGALGLDGLEGRVVAVGDWNGDQSSDLFLLSADRKTLQVQVWNRDLFRYFPSAELHSTSPIINVIPADFNRDGRLDVLLMSDGEKHGWWGGESDTVGMQVVLGLSDTEFGEKWSVPGVSAEQAILFDADGSLRPSLFGFTHVEDSATKMTPRTWLNDGTALKLVTPPLKDASAACQLAGPHSSAFIDIDGDCVPDLVLHCTKSKSSEGGIQIWLNKGKEGYVMARKYDLPTGAGPLSFADINRDGAIDIIFPTCNGYSSKTGEGSKCSINIAYNQQAPVCSAEGSVSNADGTLKCRGWTELCTADPDFAFSFSSSSLSFVTIPLSSIVPSTSSLLLSVPGHAHIPLPLRPGDYNVDGYPDLLMTVIKKEAKPAGGVFGSREGSQAVVLRNEACGRTMAGCEVAKQERGFVLGSGKGWEALEEIWDAQGASWIDLDDDLSYKGTLDILVQRSAEQGQGSVTFVQNNFYHDAFFLKAQVLNGACDGDCVPKSGSSYSPLGASCSGATYKFTVLDTLGRRGAQQIPQLPQMGYHALGLPYAFIGLGRTNNYIERMTVGVSLLSGNTTDLESIIPNSQLIINPPYPESPASGGRGEIAPVTNRPTDWRTELFLHPGDWIPWVAAAVVGTVIALAFVVLGLHEKEKREDEKERRRALHAINFQAL